MLQPDLNPLPLNSSSFLSSSEEIIIWILASIFPIYIFVFLLHKLPSYIQYMVLYALCREAERYNKSCIPKWGAQENTHIKSQKGQGWFPDYTPSQMGILEREDLQEVSLERCVVIL